MYDYAEAMNDAKEERKLLRMKEYWEVNAWIDKPFEELTDKELDEVDLESKSDIYDRTYY